MHIVQVFFGVLPTKSSKVPQISVRLLQNTETARNSTKVSWLFSWGIQKGCWRISCKLPPTHLEAALPQFLSSVTSSPSGETQTFWWDQLFFINLTVSTPWYFL